MLIHTVIRFFVLLIVLPFVCFADSSIAYFVPPKDWQIADPKSLSSHVQIGFIGKNKKGFCPSINLAIEEVDCSLDEYVLAVKKIHEMDRNNQWRELGRMKTKAGEARLTEINTKIEWGAVRMLQMMFVKEGKAYILTAAALKDEFSGLYQLFQDAFESLTITSDIYSSIEQTDKREHWKKQVVALKEQLIGSEVSDRETAFAKKDFQSAHWIPFQKKAIKDFADLGAHWQVLFLQSAQQQIFETPIAKAAS